MRWLLLALTLLAGCGEAVVDGACADGYALCGGACRPVTACGTADASALADASPGGDDATTDVVGDEKADASIEDAGDDTDASLDSGADPGLDSAPDSADDSGLDSAFDAGFESGLDSSLDSGLETGPEGGCAPPFTSPANCGGCGLACGGATPACKERLDGTWGCGPLCDAPTSLCGGRCVDLDVDPDDCGACGKVCPTGLCNGGKCRGARAGHVVVLGHDFGGAAPGLAVSRVLENAVFLSSKNPVRVLALELYPDAASLAGVKANLDAAAAASGRTYVKSSATTVADFRDRLLIDSFDVALIFDQPKAPPGAMSLVGADTQLSLDSFSRVGGVVVVLDGGAGEVPSFLTASALLGVSGHEVVTGRPVDVVAPADAIGVGVLSPYSAPSRSVAFTVTEPSSPALVTVVTEPTSSRPVVIHKVVLK